MDKRVRGCVREREREKEGARGVILFDTSFDSVDDDAGTRQHFGKRVQNRRIFLQK